MGKGRPAITAVVAASMAISVPFIGEKEGLRTDPYKDIAGIPTVCYGETRVPMRRYTPEECKAMLSKAVEEFATPVLKLTPSLLNKPYALAAATSLAYNIGLPSYKNSTARKRFNAGNFAGGCSAIKLWDKAKVNGKLQTVKGLVKRRNDEYKICINDVHV